MPAKVISSGEYANKLLLLIFNGIAYENMAFNATSSPFINLYISLHTASPGVSGNQSTNEAGYTGYTRVAVARNSSGWTVIQNSVSPVSAIVFPQAMGGSETEAYFGIGTSASGSGHLLYFGSINPIISVQNGVTPELSTDLTISET